MPEQSSVWRRRPSRQRKFVAVQATCPRAMNRNIAAIKANLALSGPAVADAASIAAVRPARSCWVSSHRYMLIAPLPEVRQSARRSCPQSCPSRWPADVDPIGGCSLQGTDPQGHALPLSFLHHYARAPQDWRVSPKPWHYVEMNLIERDRVNTKGAISLLPPLAKGYLRLGAFFSHGAIIDPQFGSIVVLVILPVSSIKKRYIQYFGSEHRW